MSSSAEVYFPLESNGYTPEEPWTVQRDEKHWYAYQADFALESLGKGPGKILVIGSPIFEALGFEEQGWDVTYMDVRTPPLLKNYFRGDASVYPLPEEAFDAVSSTCVVCHAGMGRYGDEVVEGGDFRVLRNIYRTLKPRCKAAITFGPVSAQHDQYRLGNMQRVFSLDSAKRLALHSGFEIVDLRIRDLERNIWVTEFLEPRRLDRHYLSMLLKKD